MINKCCWHMHTLHEEGVTKLSGRMKKRKLHKDIDDNHCKAGVRGGDGGRKKGRKQGRKKEGRKDEGSKKKKGRKQVRKKKEAKKKGRKKEGSKNIRKEASKEAASVWCGFLSVFALPAMELGCFIQPNGPHRGDAVFSPGQLALWFWALFPEA